MPIAQRPFFRTPTSAPGEGVEVAPAHWMPRRSVTRCLVCGFAEVRTDEVVDRGIVLLTECPRCEHRSTERLPAAAPLRLRKATAEEANAA